MVNYKYAKDDKNPKMLHTYLHKSYLFFEINHDIKKFAATILLQQLTQQPGICVKYNAFTFKKIIIIFIINTYDILT